MLETTLNKSGRPREATSANASSASQGETRSNIFICFAQEESQFARDQDEALRKSRRVSAIDWQKPDVPTSLSPDMLQRIKVAETFVFVISPSSVRSKLCLKQLEHAVALRKVIVPVVRVEVADKDLPTPLRSLQSIDYREHVDYLKSFEAVIRAVNTNLRIDVFICYARADRPFARRLYMALAESGRNTWLDLNSIPTSTLWEQEILSGIEAADNFIFLISPDSLRQDSFCHKEFEHAHANNKRIIPLYHRAVEDALVPPALAQYQRKDFPLEGEFDSNFQHLLGDLDDDPTYLRDHTRLLTRAVEWQRSNDGKGKNDRSLLLRGDDLLRAEQLIRHAADKRPQFTNLQTHYVLASREGASRTRNKMLTGVTVALVLTIVLSVGLFLQTRAANAASEAETAQRIVALEQRDLAESRRLEAETQKNLAETRRIEAETQKGIAQANERKAQLAAAAEREARKQAEERRREAERQQNIALAGQTSARSEVIRNQAAIPTEIKSYQFAKTNSTWPEVLQRSLLLSIEGANRYHAMEGRFSLEAGQALRSGLSMLPRSATPLVHDMELEGAMFTADGRLLISFDKEDQLTFWDVVEKKVIAKFKALNEDAKTFSPNGHYFATSDDGTLSLREVKGNINERPALWSKKDAGELTINGFSADERQLVTSNKQGVTLWDTVSGDKRLHLDHRADEIKTVTFSPDGLQVVTVDEKSVHVWSTSTGKELFSIENLEWARVIAFSGDGKLMAIVDKNTAGVWDAGNGKKVKAIPGIPAFDDEVEYITNARFSSDAKRLVLMGDEGTTQLWDIETAEVLWVVGEAYGAVPSGEYIIMNHSPGFEVWDPTLPKEVARIIDGHDVDSFSYDPVNKLLALAAEKTIWLYATGGGQEEGRVTYTGNNFRPVVGDKYIAVRDEKSVLVWDTESAREIARISLDGVLDSHAFSADENYLATTGDDQTLRIWEVPSGTELKRIDGIPTIFVEHSEEDGDREARFISKFFFSSSGKHVVIVGKDGSARVWEVPSGRQVAHVKSDVSDFSFSPGEQYFVTVSNSKASIFDTATGKELRSVIHQGAKEVVFSPDGECFTTASDDAAKVWATATGEHKATFTHGTNNLTKDRKSSRINNVAFSPDAKYLFTAGDDQTARVWDIADKREVARLPHGDSVGYVGLSPDGKYLVTACLTDHTYDSGFKGTSDVYLWNIVKKQVWLKASHRDLAKHFAFSADGRYFATASRDRTAQVFDLIERRRLSVLNHDERVNSIEFSPDGNHLATSSSDYAVRVWETRSGRDVAQMTHGDEVFMATFSKDGRRLSTASMDKTLKVWPWRAGDLIAKACNSLTRNLTRDEWRQHFGQETYKRTCPNLPALENRR